MQIDNTYINAHNEILISQHEKSFHHLHEHLQESGYDVETIIKNLMDFQVGIPSWALGTGGTRFGRFPEGGEPRSLEEKIQDVGLLHALNRSSGAISLHIPWDIPEDTRQIKKLAKSFDLKFDAVNSNTFQDQKRQKHSYKFGSLAHAHKKVRKQSVAHNKEVIDIGAALGSDALTVWLADGACFPGQNNFKEAFRNTLDSLTEIYEHMPKNWTMLVEYKPYEPNFYATVIQDWGTSFLLASKLGKKARCLVDLGHHLPNTNIEQIVATLLMEEKLGGFHFNDSKYGDDDLTVGSIKPYQLFLIFNELIKEKKNGIGKAHSLYYMIDASHNLKDPLEDLLQSVEAMLIAYAQTMLVDRKKLTKAQQQNDVTMAQETLQWAYRTDVRPLLAEARLRSEAALDPLGCYRHLHIRKQLIAERGKAGVATGL